MIQICSGTSNISALLHSLWSFSNRFWCHNCPSRISAECGMLLVHIHITESYWYDCSPIVFIAKIFSNENGKCVVLDLRLFLGTRWYYTRKVQLTVCYQHDRALASDIPLWPLQSPWLLTICRTEFLLSMHKDKGMSHFWIHQLLSDAVEIHCSFSTSLYKEATCMYIYIAWWCPNKILLNTVM